jgi:hypothetical protein
MSFTAVVAPGMAAGQFCIAVPGAAGVAGAAGAAGAPAAAPVARRRDATAAKTRDIENPVVVAGGYSRSEAAVKLETPT